MTKRRTHLVALSGGPFDGQWFWLEDWHRQGRPDYQPTGRYVDNSQPRYGQGEVWRYTPPTPPADTAVPEGWCPKCRRPAPRLITFPAAGREPDVRCPRCAYPAQLYLASRVETMPAADQAWYDTQPYPPAAGTARSCAKCGDQPPGPGGVLCPACATALTRPASDHRRGRVLVTGSRTWTDVADIRAVLRRVRQCYPDAALLVHGDARGADRIAAQVWRSWGLPTEAHPAEWDRHGKAAGLLRNRAMVAAGAVVCVAFIRNHSPGATHCAGLAEQAGIPTWRHQAGAA